MNSTASWPPPSRSAASIDSTSRARWAGSSTSRSSTTATGLSTEAGGGAARSQATSFTRTRAKPRRVSPAQSSAGDWPAGTGSAKVTSARAPACSDSRVSAMDSGEWEAAGLPHCGQCTRPILA